MRTLSLATPAVFAFVAVCGCARKGDPVPRPAVRPLAPDAAWASTRELEVRLPVKDAQGGPLRGLEAVRVLYLPLGLARPTAGDVFSRGEVVLERQRPGLAAPGESMRLDLKGLNRPAGWIVVVVVRTGAVVSPPSSVLSWMDSAL
jgi:hypothetical protein